MDLHLKVPTLLPTFKCLKKPDENASILLEPSLSSFQKWVRYYFDGWKQRETGTLPFHKRCSALSLLVVDSRIKRKVEQSMLTVVEKNRKRKQDKKKM